MSPDRDKPAIPKPAWYVRSPSSGPIALVLGTAFLVSLAAVLIHPLQVVEAGDPRSWVTVHLTVAIVGGAIGVATVLAVVFAAERIGWRLAVAASGYSDHERRLRDLELVHQAELLELHRKRLTHPPR